MDVLDAQVVADTFPPDGASGPVALLGPIFDSNGGYYNVETNPVYAQYAYGVYGAYYWSEPVPIPVGPAILQPGTVGVRFRNYIAGSAAVVSGALSEKGEPSVQITSGGIPTTPTVAELATADISADTSTASAVMVDLVSTPATVYAAGNYYCELTIPILRSNIAANATFFLLTDAANVQQAPVAQIDSVGAGVGACVFLRFPFVSVGGSQAYKIRWDVSAGGTATVRATGLLPARMRIITDV